MAVVVVEVKPAMFFCLHKLCYILGQHAAQKAKVAHLFWVLFEYGSSPSHACMHGVGLGTDGFKVVIYLTFSKRENSPVLV